MPLPVRRRGRKKRATDFFIYSTEFDGVLVGSTATNTINIQADSDFRIEKITHFTIVDVMGDINSGTFMDPLSQNVIVPNHTILITDTGSGRQIMDAPIPLAAMFGDGRVPFILGTPRILDARATLTIQLTNFDIATGDPEFRTWLAFIGTKIFQD